MQSLTYSHAHLLTYPSMPFPISLTNLLTCLLAHTCSPTHPAIPSLFPSLTHSLIFSSVYLWICEMELLVTNPSVKLINYAYPHLFPSNLFMIPHTHTHRFFLLSYCVLVLSAMMIYKICTLHGLVFTFCPKHIKCMCWDSYSVFKH